MLPVKLTLSEVLSAAKREYAPLHHEWNVKFHCILVAFNENVYGRTSWNYPAAFDNILSTFCMASDNRPEI